MGQSSSTPEKSALASNPVNLDVTKQYGSGAEQDRYGQHFAQAGAVAGEKIRDGLSDLKSLGGSGAEQDRYGAHFATDPDKVRDAAAQGYNKAKSSVEQGYYQAKDSAERGYSQAKDTAERGYDQARSKVEKGYSQAKDSAERGYDQARTKVETGYSQVKATAEQGYDRAKEAMDKALNAKGSGAEQDLYGTHFDYNTLDLAPVTRAAMSIIRKGGNLDSASRHGLGHDGWERAKMLAAYKGSGAEQDRYEARFSRIGQQAAQAIKDKVNELR